jgi:hypothetical protein
MPAAVNAQMRAALDDEGLEAGLTSLEEHTEFLAAGGINLNHWRDWNRHTYDRAMAATKAWGPGWAQFQRDIEDARRDPEHPNNKTQRKVS